jgi:hypothetical protein
MWNFVGRSVWHSTKVTKINKVFYGAVTGTGLGIIATPFGVLTYLNM